MSSAPAPTATGRIASPGPSLPAAAPPSPVDPPAAVGQQLLAEFIQYGRQRPFEEIVRRYAGMVFNVCFRVTKDKHDAEDATQAVFLTLATQAKRGAEIKALGPWLQQVAKRLALDVRRGKKRRKSREERHHDAETRRRTDLNDAAVPSPDLDELKTILHEELQKLPAKYRLPLILHYFGGMTRDEMAAELNCKPSTLGVRIFRGREMLAGRLNGRGVHLSAGAMALAIGYLVKRTVTDAMVLKTSHAAAALAAGAHLSTVGDLLAAHDGATTAATRVVGLTRRASHALVIGKVRVTVALSLLAATSLGAGVKAFALLPPIHMDTVGRLLTNGVARLVRPLVEPLSRPLRADANPVPPPDPVVDSVELSAGRRTHSDPAGPLSTPRASDQAGPADPAVAPAVGPAAPLSTDARPATTVASFRIDPATLADAAPTMPTPVVNRLTDGVTPDANLPMALPRHTAVSGIDIGNVRPGPSPLQYSAGDATSVAVVGTVTTAADDLYVPSAAASGSATAAAGVDSSVFVLGGTASGSSSAVQVLQIPAVGGSVTESNGVVRGYGKIDRHGTLSVSGKVIADGFGVDRTLDLTGFSAVTVAPVADAAGSASTTTGWYAVNHGRLSLPLLSAPGASATALVGPVSAKSPKSSAAAAPPPPPSTGPEATLTWGADPSAATLTPVNSVRLSVLSGPVPTVLSLLSTDRTDAPAVPADDGSPIGIWQVDPPAAAMAAVDLIVRYDDQMVGQLGDCESNVRLWTLDAPGAPWTPVDDLSVDVSRHLVSGSATDVGYFAVTVLAGDAVPTDPPRSAARPALRRAAIRGASVAVVPEPATAAVLAAMATVGLLGRRRPAVPT